MHQPVPIPARHRSTTRPGTAIMLHPNAPPPLWPTSAPAPRIQLNSPPPRAPSAPDPAPDVPPQDAFAMMRGVHLDPPPPAGAARARRDSAVGAASPLRSKGGSPAEERRDSARIERRASCFGLFGGRGRVERRRRGGPEMGVSAAGSGGDGAASGVDARTAANERERHVRIVHDRTTAVFPVTSTTTASDLARSAARHFLTNPHFVVLVEHYARAGIQRPLRHYESVRPVLDSWDGDDANALLLVPSSSTGTDPSLLLASSAPPLQPNERPFSTLLHSRVPGKWTPRHVLLRSYGLVATKKSPAAPDAPIAHMALYDVYLPTPRHLADRIKAPARYCLALKRTQRADDQRGFVHFFCTHDRDEAAAFYAALHRWRSHHLRAVRGDDGAAGVAGGARGSMASVDGTERRGDVPRPVVDGARDAPTAMSAVHGSAKDDGDGEREKEREKGKEKEGKRGAGRANTSASRRGLGPVAEGPFRRGSLLAGTEAREGGRGGGGGGGRS